MRRGLAALAVAVLLLALPGVAAAQPYGHAFAGAISHCKAGGQQIAWEAQHPYDAYGTRNFGQAASQYYTPPKDGSVPMINMESYCEPGPYAP